MPRHDSIFVQHIVMNVCVSGSIVKVTVRISGPMPNTASMCTNPHSKSSISQSAGIQVDWFVIYGKSEG
jgi:hypothetical protein